MGDDSKTQPSSLLTAALRKFVNDDGAFLASGLAFGLLFFCIPFALLSVSALSYALASSDAALLWVRRYSLTLVPRSQDVFDNAITAIIPNRGLFGAFGFLAFLFASSTTFGSVRLVLNRVFGIRESRGMLHGKLVEIVMMLATSLLFFVMVAVVYSLNVVHALAANVKYLAFLHPGFVAIGYIVSLASSFALFWFLYRYSPAKSTSPKALIVSALTSTILFELSKWAFGVYLRYAQGAKALYGALGTLVFFLLWLYYVSVIFIFAAEVGCVLDQRKDRTASGR